MPTAAIKICGINSSEALEASIKARAAHIGLVFFPRSPRAVSPNLAAQLSTQAKGRISRVGLFVDADDATISEAMAAAQLDVLQLHGEESPQRVAQLRAQFGIPVWKALPVASSSDVERSTAYTGAADLILFDAKTPKGTLPGGMGLSFDWNLLANRQIPIAWGLAGGLNPSNVAEAIVKTGTPLVDTSSGVESEPGIKDTSKIAEFCSAVRNTA